MTLVHTPEVTYGQVWDVVGLDRFTHRGKKTLQTCCILRLDGKFSAGYHQLYKRHASMEEAQDIIAPLESIDGVKDAFYTYRNELVVIITKETSVDTLKPLIIDVLAKAGI
jgi:hypothetical protein